MFNNVGPTGFEPVTTAPKTVVLPLHHGPIYLLFSRTVNINLLKQIKWVGRKGIEHLPSESKSDVQTTTPPSYLSLLECWKRRV